MTEQEVNLIIRGLTNLTDLSNEEIEIIRLLIDKLTRTVV